MDIIDLLLKLIPLLISAAAIGITLRKAPVEREATEAATNKLKAETLASIDKTMVDMLGQLRSQATLILSLSQQLEECHQLLASGAAPQETLCPPPSVSTS